MEKVLEKKGSSYELKLAHPVIEGAPDALNKSIAESALTHLEQVEDDPIPFEEYAKNIAAESAGQQWALESILTIERHNPRFLTAFCKTYTNTGAAHPNVFHYYEVYDAATGKRIEAMDLLESGKAGALRSLAKVEPNAYPNEPEIGLYPDHLLYQPDPDSRMVPGVQIPYAQLKGILKPEFFP